MFPPEKFPGFRVEPAPAPPGILLWDGGCGLCSKSILLLRRYARLALPDAPIQSYPGQLPDVGDQVVWVDAQGQIFGGTRAIAAALACAGHPTLARMLTLPLLNRLFRAIYRVVVRHRHRLDARACPTRQDSSKD
jgi:predicted DCC family thiol-disulfide oxidoreductase YuxK